MSQPGSICPLACLKAYSYKTKNLRKNETKLFISYVRPHRTVSRDTISTWTKETLRLCGIDTKVFTAHSTRSASVSKANEKDVPVHEIMAKAGWKSSETFRKYYNKPVVQGNRLASAILDQWKGRNVPWISHVLFSLILILLDHKLQTYLSLLMLDLLLLCGFHASCLSACHMGASTL